MASDVRTYIRTWLKAFRFVFTCIGLSLSVHQWAKITKSCRFLYVNAATAATGFAAHSQDLSKPRKGTPKETGERHPNAMVFPCQGRNAPSLTPLPRRHARSRKTVPLRARSRKSPPCPVLVPPRCCHGQTAASNAPLSGRLWFRYGHNTRWERTSPRHT